VLALGLLLAGVVSAVGAYTATFPQGETYVSCYDEQGEPPGVSSSENNLTEAENLTFPLGYSCSWEMADGSVLTQPSYPETENVFLVLGLGLIAASAVVVVRGIRRPADSVAAPDSLQPVGDQR